MVQVVAANHTLHIADWARITALASRKVRWGDWALIKKCYVMACHGLSRVCTYPANMLAGPLLASCNSMMLVSLQST